MLSSLFSLELGNWVSFKPFFGKLRLPLYELSSELDRLFTSIDLINESVFFATTVSNAINVFLGSFSGTVNFKFVGFSTDPKVNCVPGIQHHNISVDKIFLSIVDNFFAEEVARAVGASEKTRLKVRVDRVTFLNFAVITLTTKGSPKFFWFLTFFE